MREFRLSFVVTGICLALAAWWGHSSGMGLFTALWLCVVLGILEVSLSFDNAVVNAGVLKDMDEFWRQMFLTVGILIAVFGMRLVFPIVIVAVTTSQGPFEVMKMAIETPDDYSAVLTEHYPTIAAFGGMFLLLVFLNFFVDQEKDTHWIGGLEHLMARLGSTGSFPILVAMALLVSTVAWLPAETVDAVVFAGLCGILLYVAVDSLDGLFEPEVDDMGVAKRAGIAAFLYLEVLDASFSFDGVIGAFAITRDVVIIMLGLAIGAMYVRSMTVYLVRRGTLDQFIYLEHGAHYAIGILAVIMLAGTVAHVPEVITGLIGVSFIGASIWSSVLYRRANPESVTLAD